MWTLDRVRIHDLHPVDGREERGAAELALPLRQTLERELRRVGVELFAVVELHALAELHLPRRGRNELRHLRGEVRHDLQILVTLVERVEDVPADVRRRALGLIRHVERRRIDALRDDDLAGRRRARRHRQQQDDGGDDDSRCDHLKPPLRASSNGKLDFSGFRYSRVSVAGESRYASASSRVVTSPRRLRFARPVEQAADRGAGRQAEARHDVLAPHQRRRRGAGALASLPTRAGGPARLSRGARPSGATPRVTAAASTRVNSSRSRVSSREIPEEAIARARRHFPGRGQVPWAQMMANEPLEDAPGAGREPEPLADAARARGPQHVVLEEAHAAVDQPARLGLGDIVQQRRELEDLASRAPRRRAPRPRARPARRHRGAARPDAPAERVGSPDRAQRVLEHREAVRRRLGRCRASARFPEKSRGADPSASSRRRARAARGSASSASSSSRTRSAATPASPGAAERMARVVPAVSRKPSAASSRTPRSVRSGSSVRTRASGTRSRRGPEIGEPAGRIDDRARVPDARARAIGTASAFTVKSRAARSPSSVGARQSVTSRHMPRASTRARRRAPGRVARTPRPGARPRGARDRARPTATATSRSVPRVPRVRQKHAASRTAPPTSTGDRARPAADCTARSNARAGGARDSSLKTTGLTPRGRRGRRP